MKYKVGDKTLLGEIVQVDERNTRYPYLIKLELGDDWLTESEIDKIILKPKRNIDHIIELWESGNQVAAQKYFDDCTVPGDGYESDDDLLCLMDTYREEPKYPKLTPDELKAVKWLVDGGYTAVHAEQTNVVVHVGKGTFSPLTANFPIIERLFDAKWITSEPINLKELLDAQEVDN